MIPIHFLVEQEQVRGTEHVDEKITRQQIFVSVHETQIIHVLLVPVRLVLKVEAGEFRRQDVAEGSVVRKAGKGEQFADDKVIRIRPAHDQPFDLGLDIGLVRVSMAEGQRDVQLQLDRGVAFVYGFIDRAGCVLFPFKEAV